MSLARKALSLVLLVAAAGCDGGEPKASQVEAVSRDAGVDAALDWRNGGEDTPEYSLGRLLISHLDAPELTLFDLDTAQLVARVPFAARAPVETGGSGRYGYAFSSAEGALRVFDPGQWLLSHIDHFHVIRGEHRLMVEQVGLPTMSALRAYDGWITAYAASTGLVAFFQERSITAGSFAPAVVSVPQPPATGVALVSRAQLIASEGAELGQRSVLEPTQALARFAGCSEPSGIAAQAARMFIGCAEGLLTLRWDARQELFLPELIRVEGERVIGVRTTERFDGALVQLGTRAVGIIAASAADMRRVELSNDIVSIEIRRQGNAALLLTADGSAHELDLSAATIARSTPILPALSDESSLVHLTLSHAYAYVSDPRSPRVLALRLRTMQLEAEVPLHSPAYDLAVVGVPGNYTDERE